MPGCDTNVQYVVHRAVQYAQFTWRTGAYMR